PRKGPFASAGGVVDRRVGGGRVHADEEDVVLGKSLPEPTAHDLAVAAIGAHHRVAAHAFAEAKAHLAAGIVGDVVHAVRSLGGVRPFISEAVVMVLAR